MADKIYEEEKYRVEIMRDTRTGVAVHESWAKDGCGTHREDGPAMISRDARTGIVTQEWWLKGNKYHREDGPAVIKRKADTGKIYYTVWYRNGEKVKPPRPERRLPGAPKGPAPS